MSQSSQATWGGRFSEKPSALMQRFSESVSFDARLAPYDIACSLAHAEMLKEVGLLTARDFQAIRKGLRAIEQEVRAGTFRWDPALEDVHMNIEQALTRRVPAAARLHTGRSRNDQVATDMRLFFKDACAAVLERLRAVLEALLERAEAAEADGVRIPGYTHLQRAQPVPMAHHFLAYLEMFGRDLDRFASVKESANVCPLGSGALAGSTLPLDRERTARLLGFVDRRGRPRLSSNSMDAVADRDVFLEFGYAANLCALHLSRLAEDFILWSSAEFGFIRLPDAFTTGSSLMPQKKNPDALELIRGKAGRIIGCSHQLEIMVKGLPLTYNRDLQEDKPAVFDAYDQLAACLEVLAAMLPGLRWMPARCAAATADPMLLATDLADWLVEQGVPFREAHHAVGDLVKRAEDAGCSLPELDAAAAAAVHPAIRGDWRAVFDLDRAVDARTQPGMAGRRPLKQALRRWRRRMEKTS